ncbi:hydroxymethylglutaryl-CoA reductase [Streptosporangium becharense]|uniref:Hydroxymethylglutaryl-CoA reductase n=1 Tax=Streptosporangium becharense TaxID=1816182 RepID=A0A7W9IFL9_9ACTN|nr:hypothetical protein [Streptosporangium becharense]MBB2909209.1 hydroxymethylglutaryl-CoA reductase [Streptosporangium becharense]MBB5819772.1 hydroxymethylglutaryl-CoA reductase [Streptosporangium becharense]
MPGQLFAAGTLAASMFVAPIATTAVSLAAPAMAASSVAVVAGGDTYQAVNAAPADWRKGPRFSTKSKCQSYGHDQHHDRWNCRKSKGSWYYWYWRS